MLRKDLLVLRRSRLTVAILVVYPIVVALLVGLAISRSPAKPRVAIVNLAAHGQSVQLGGRQIGLAQYVSQLFREVHVIKAASKRAAIEDVTSGDALAAVVIPRDIVSKLSSSVSQAHIQAIYNGDALQQSYVRAAIDSALARANLALSTQIKDVALQDLQLILRGGKLGILQSPTQIVGLKHIPPILHSIAKAQASRSARAQLRKIAAFAAFAAQNLNLSGKVLSAVSQPIAAKRILLHGKRIPLDRYAVLVAVTLSLMFIALLTAAGAVALEREDHLLNRLLSAAGHHEGLISARSLVSEKIALAAVLSFPLGVALLYGINAFVALGSVRLPQSLLALAVAAIAFAALGSAIGALAREVSAASLLSFLVSLPLVFLALVPRGAVDEGLYRIIAVVNFVFPFKAGVQILDAAVNRSSPSLPISLLHLAVLSVAFASVALVGIKRRS